MNNNDIYETLSSIESAFSRKNIQIAIIIVAIFGVSTVVLILLKRLSPANPNFQTRIELNESEGN